MSILDIPKPTLDPKVWDCSKGDCRIRPEVRNLILDTLTQYFIYHLNTPNIYSIVDVVLVVGSIATYQWREDSDIDVTVLLQPQFVDSHEYSVLKRNVSSINGLHTIGEHPINYYFRFTLAPSSYDGIYDLTHNIWLRRPKELEPFDPRVKFFSIWSKFQAWAEGVDEDLAELRRNLIDYEELQKSLAEVPEELYAPLYKMIADRVAEINRIIEDLVDQYKDLWKDRHKSYEVNRFLDLSAEEILSLAWLPEDIKYKFAERYRYTELLATLKQMMRTKGYIKSEKDIEELIDKVNEFYQIPKTTEASLFRAFTKEGYKPRFRYPFKYMKKKLLKDKKKSLPVSSPQGFMITEKNIANEIPVAMEEGFNTMSETKPIPGFGYDKLPAWEEADSLLQVPASIEKQAQEDDAPDIGGGGDEAPSLDLPEGGEEMPAGDDFPAEGRDNDPTVKELRKILDPSETDLSKTNQGEGATSPESFFKSVKPTLPNTIREMSSYDRALFTALEKKRVDAINNLDVATLRELDAEIEKMVEKYSNPIPAPEPMVDSSTVAASYHYASYMDDLSKAVQAVYKRFAELGIPVKDLRLGYQGDAVFEFIADIPVRLRLQDASWTADSMYATAHVETTMTKPVIVRAQKIDGSVIPYVWTLDGKVYELNKDSVMELLSDLAGAEVDYVVGL